MDLQGTPPAQPFSRNGAPRTPAHAAVFVSYTARHECEAGAVVQGRGREAHRLSGQVRTPLLAFPLLANPSRFTLGTKLTHACVWLGRYGGRWSKIARSLPGRAEAGCRARWAILSANKTGVYVPPPQVITPRSTPLPPPLVSPYSSSTVHLTHSGTLLYSRCRNRRSGKDRRQCRRRRRRHGRRRSTRSWPRPISGGRGPMRG